jgi:hypothetical protein
MGRRTQLRAERQRWGELVEAAEDLRELARLVQPVLRQAQVPCDCLDGTCRSCRMWRIVDCWAR